MTKIMLVEDDKSLREIYGVRLLAEGYDIISAGDGEEALAMAIKERPQLIISDVMMPKISGFDMLDILRSTTETKNIRVIMMTALSSDEQRQRGEQLGADKYLVKSQVGIEDVVKAVHEVLGDTPGAANAPNPVGGTPPATPQPAGPTQAPQMSQGSPEPTTTIPQPTAPFTGERPAGLGDRVIQPLADNPRVSKVDINDLVTKDMAANVQSIENNPALDIAPPSATPAAAPAPDPAATPQPLPAPQPAQSTPVTMSAPTAAQPAADDPSILASLSSAQSTQSPPTLDPQIPQQPPITSPIVSAPLQYEESTPPQVDRSENPITPPERPAGIV